MLRGTFDAPEGASMEVIQHFDIDNASILQRIGENEITGTMSISRSEHQTIRFLAGGGREIEIGEGGSTITTQMGDTPAEEETQADPLTGKRIIGTPGAGGEWSYTIKGDPESEVPAGFASADLRADELYPTDWKSFGESWSPEPSALGSLLDPSFQLKSGDITLRLLSYTKRRGQACAEISADIQAEGVFQADLSRQDVKLRLEGKIYRSLHLYQDLEAELVGTIEIHQRLGNAEVRIEGPVSFRREGTWHTPVDEEGEKPST